MGTCFVAMPISVPDEYVSIYSDGQQHFGHVLDHLFTPAIQACGYEVVPPVASGADLIHAEIIRNLEQADIVLCDISCLNPNVFFELGIRTALDRPVVIVKDDHTPRIPFDTGSINTHSYESALTPWSLDAQRPALIRHIQQAIGGADGRNPLWRYFGLTRRADPAEIANPTEAKLDLILSELAELRRPQPVIRPAEPAAPQWPPVQGSGYGRAPEQGPVAVTRPAEPMRSAGEPMRSAGQPAASPLPGDAAVPAAFQEGYTFGEGIARDAPELWLQAVLARRPRMPGRPGGQAAPGLGPPHRQPPP